MPTQPRETSLTGATAVLPAGGAARLRDSGAALRGAIVAVLPGGFAGMLSGGFAAVGFGALGWLCGDEVVHRLLAHQHAADHGVATGVAHVHNSRAATAIIVGFLAATVVIAALVAKLRREREPAAGRRQTAPFSVPIATALSTAGFLAAELLGAGSATSGMTPDRVVPPPLILLVGCLVQALIGAGGALLWRASLAGVRRTMTFLYAAPAAPAAGRAELATGRPQRPLPRWAVARLPARAPPLRPA